MSPLNCSIGVIYKGVLMTNTADFIKDYVPSQLDDKGLETIEDVIEEISDVEASQADLQSYLNHRLEQLPEIAKTNPTVHADVDEAMRLIREYDKRLDMLEKLRHKKMKEY